MKIKKNRATTKKTIVGQKDPGVLTPASIPLNTNRDREQQPMLKGFIGTVTQEEDLRLW